MSLSVSTLEPGSVLALVGVPGSGKSTFARRFPAPWRICLDVYRELATDDAADQTATPVAAQIQDLLLDARLARHLNVIVDSTNLHPHVRAKLLAKGRYWNRPVSAVLFDLPLALCLAQNASRNRVVPDDVLYTLHEMLPTREQLLDEGFADVHLAPAPAMAGGDR
ncbi:AAA family ATPase [Streptomyces sp. WMMC1477]|uniref:AAA family ATPase n=1 Tax=Streptomyces sp. WMMC1477 TaxID=3015155 RepID=UPI0022B6BC8F|nr:AAA family ATPase [Streptomyces sp. WMMC1477]MCZ7430110.1 AAA family ATPase [Streptomyces sp. WMMC1477]